MAKSKNRSTPMGKQSEQSKALSEKANLQLQLLTGPELRINKKAKLDSDVIELLNGSVINLSEITAEIKRYITALQKYSPTFPKEFYQQINRLNGWAKADDKVYQKPPIVAQFTNDLIYRRFPKAILPALQHLNPYVVFGLRKYKHFQRLNDDGRIKLEQYIEEAVKLMTECTTWNEFRLKYSEKYPIPDGGQQRIF